jgi:methyl-accepting chemotaxis protein
MEMVIIMSSQNIQQKFIKHSIRTKLIIAMFLLMVISFVIVGTFTYYTAKTELDRSGEIIMMNGVNMIKEAIQLKKIEISEGLQDKESAQEEIKRFILGPMDSEGNRPINKNIDLGEHGYFFILDKDANEIAHPSIEGQNTWDTLDMSGREFFVARDIIEKALEGGGFTYYSWKYPYTERIAPKVSYAEVDPNWDWIVVASIYMEDFNHGANSIIDALTITFFISFFIGILIIFLTSRHISTPLINISKEMNQFY